MDQRMLIPSETLIDDRQDVTTDARIRLAPGNSGFQVDGPGMVDTVLVRGQTPAFRVEMETDSTVLVNDDWVVLDALSADLSHISAYEDDGEFVVVVEDYPYQEFSTVSIVPDGEVTFDRIRGEWILGLPVSY